MINKDYLLRLAEQFGRELAILIGLRERNKHEDALIYIDNLLLRTVGLTSRSINVLSEEMLVQMLSPLGALNVEKALWIALMLKAEGEIYEEIGKQNESYYRFLKSLYLFITVLLHEPLEEDAHFYADTRELLLKLEDYELPAHVKLKLFAYYEHIGQYAHAEDTLFELLESTPHDRTLLAQGLAFYKHLLAKSDADLEAGNLAREEVYEGLAQLQQSAPHES